MAILPTPTPEQQQASAAQATTSAPVQPGQEPMTIPLDEPVAPRPRRIVRTLDDDEDEVSPRKARLRRDSMRHREALQKGNEGSRRRQRWENDNFLNHPSYAPPNPSDYYPQPLHPTRIVRYEFATLWDPSNPAKFGYGTAHHIPGKDKEAEKRVPKNLKDRLKRSKGAMDLLKSLEEEVRRYAASLWGCGDDDDFHRHPAAAIKPHAAGEGGGVKLDEDGDQMMFNSIVVEEELKDSEDEEIVFIPRMKTITLLDENVEEPPSPERQQQKQLQKRTDREEIYIPVLGPPLEKSVFEAPPNDQSASFGRWLVHSIALYYGLRSWSVTQGNPAMRIAFVGAQPSEKRKRKSGALVKHPKTLPRPLWMML